MSDAVVSASVKRLLPNWNVSFVKPLLIALNALVQFSTGILHTKPSELYYGNERL